MPNAIFEAWEKIFIELKLDTTKDQHTITAAQIKEIANQEPRLMAKMDSSQDVPPVMKQHGYFLLPVSRTSYTIVKGHGFHQLEKLSKPVKEFSSQIKFNLVTNGRNTSEMQHLDYCSSTGLIEEVVGRGRLYQMIRGREGSGQYSFKVNKNNIEVNSAQIEVDSGFEGYDSIVLMEAKSKTPEDFIIRQLYYPYRKFTGLQADKQVLPVFFAHEPSEKTYSFWQYRFEDLTNYNSIQLVSSQSYIIREHDTLEVEDITEQHLSIGTKKLTIPQANDLDKVQQLIYMVSQGRTNAAEVAEKFGFNPRQSSYYREAAEALGFITLSGPNYTLTNAGRQLVSLDAEDRNVFFARAVNEFELFKRCMDLLQRKGSLTRHDIEAIIGSMSDLSGTTIPRRAASIESWLKWVAAKTGTFSYQSREFTVS